MSGNSKNSENAKNNTKVADNATQFMNFDYEFKATLSSGSTNHNSRCKSPCKHASHQRMKATAFTKLLPSEHWAAHGLQQIDETTESSVDVYQAHRIINDAFVKRLQEIEQKAPNALEVKLGTYKDWVSVLQRLNNVLLNDFDELEKTIEQHLSLHESRSSYAFRRDVATLVKFIRQVYHHNNWNLAGMKFETITPTEILGLNEDNPRDREILHGLLDEKDTSRKSKSDPYRKDLPADSIKALADEVARRHDEISRLKREICCLEDEIKKADKKIQLKDEYIRKLNVARNADKSDLQEFPCKYCCQRKMAPINMENLAEALQKEKENRSKSMSKKPANENTNEVQGLIESSLWQNKNSLGDINAANELLAKLDLDRLEAIKRINTIRCDLMKIISPLSTENHEINMKLTDEMLLQAIRERFEYIYSFQEELKQEKDKLIKEKAEISGELIFLKKNKASNDEALRELSDLLSSMTGEVCSYEAIYDPQAAFNPFCQAICHIKNETSAKIGELKAQLEREKEERAVLEKELSQLKRLENQSPQKNDPKFNFTIEQQKKTSTQNLIQTTSSITGAAENNTSSSFSKKT